MTNFWNPYCAEASRVTSGVHPAQSLTKHCEVMPDLYVLLYALAIREGAILKHWLICLTCPCMRA